MEYLIALIVFVLLVAFTAFENKKTKGKTNGLFEGRESITNTEFYEKYFKKNNIPEHIVYGVKNILEKELDTDLSRLQAEDDFSTNLSVFFALDSMADVEIVIAIEKQFNIKISDKEAEKTHTIRDIINLIESKINEKPNK